MFNCVQGIERCQESPSGDSFPYRYQLEEDVSFLTQERVCIFLTNSWKKFYVAGKKIATETPRRNRAAYFFREHHGEGYLGANFCL